MARRAEEFANRGITRTQWRVSSTMFTHFRNDVDVGPMEELAHIYDPAEAATYERMTAYDLLMQELSATGMTAEQNSE